jgi:hypothetical protein
MERSHIWYRYGLSQADYDSRLAEQGGLCAVCRCAPRIVNGIERPLSVDHDHITSENRDLLCDSCNLILGYAKDEPERLRRLAEYLVKHGKRYDTFVENNPETTAMREQAWQQSLEEFAKN